MSKDVLPLAAIICGPAGAGKGTLISRLLNDYPLLHLSVSTTTRPPRPGEIDGVHYHFRSDLEFADLIRKDCFVEYFEVHGRGYYYGTLKDEVCIPLDCGRGVVFDIDVNGRRAILPFLEEHFPAVRKTSVFVKPPAPEMDILRERMKRRDPGISGSEVAKRLETAAREIERARCERFDAFVVNADGRLDEAYAALLSALGLAPEPSLAG